MTVNPTGTRADAVYHQVRTALLTASFKPGQWLRVSDLQREYGVSISVVREALSRLAAEGLLVVEANRGFRVLELSIEDLRELTEARVRIEVMLLESSIENGDPKWQANLLAAAHLLEATPMIDREAKRVNPGWIPVHAEFHEALLAGCPNRRLRGIAGALRDSAELYRMWSPTVPIREADVVAEHRDLCRLALSGATLECQELLARHIGHTLAALTPGDRPGHGPEGPAS